MMRWGRALRLRQMHTAAEAAATGLLGSARDNHTDLYAAAGFGAAPPILAEKEGALEARTETDPSCCM